MISPEKAIDELEDMQKQIIHGTNIFGEIAKLIRHMQSQLHSQAKTRTDLQSGERHNDDNSD